MKIRICYLGLKKIKEGGGEPSGGSTLRRSLTYCTIYPFRLDCVWSGAYSGRVSSRVCMYARGHCTELNPVAERLKPWEGDFPQPNKDRRGVALKSCHSR